MKIRNPNFVDPTSAFVAANKANIDSWIKSRPGEWITDDQIRAQFPALAAQLTDGMIAEIAKALNLTVER